MLLTIREAAERLRVSPRTVRRLVAQGELSVIRLTKTVKGNRIDPADLDEFIERKRGRAGSAAIDTQAKDDELQRRLAVRPRRRRP